MVFSQPFLRDELQYTDGFERHNIFHGNDKQITVDELWVQWKQSEVYNWTVDDVLDWVTVSVDLPQYAENFRVNAVDGTVLPRIAANSNHFLSGILGIKNPVHKQKLSLKAMDVVLFGPPKKGHSYIKDIALVASLVIAIGGCWFAYIQHKYSQSHMKKMITDLDNLQRAEDALTELQEKLQRAQKSQQEVVQEKQHLEAKMKDEIQDAKLEAERLKLAREGTEADMTRLKLAEEELAQVRSALLQAERELENMNWRPPADLQDWLQLTYEIELTHYNTKKLSAERQLAAAKDACERIRKKRSAFMGSLRLAHSSSIDDVDRRIIDARSSLEEVGRDLQERLQRWRQIEELTGFAILTNPGMAQLSSKLYGSSHPQGHDTAAYLRPTDLDDGSDEDIPPGYHAAVAHLAAANQYLRHSCSFPGQLSKVVTELAAKEAKLRQQGARPGEIYALRWRARTRIAHLQALSHASLNGEQRRISRQHAHAQEDTSSSSDVSPTGQVVFGIEESCQNDQSSDKSSTSSQLSTYKQSKSLDRDTMSVSRKPLVNSCSEGSLSTLSEATTESRKRLSTFPKHSIQSSVPSTVAEEHSSPEEGSTEHLDHSDRKEKKKRKLLPNFLKKDHSDKWKTS
ncbi:stromal interaction molecule 1-like [Lingula anatina]|uniref:Stromal interaction molecule 1-like n=1 Tax=Lingula anatina TaxID=7574 RepID=A0A1S3JAS9_LINAN|nr:stromal interaction molecule 1-like [Lingula anatina]|eukprot:XP_013407301.1 stromal interaction molecule 1-like [Lingula anatina]